MNEQRTYTIYDADPASSRQCASPGTLCDYDTAEELRAATQSETDASIAQARRDGGAGVISVDGRRCYVEGGVAS